MEHLQIDQSSAQDQELNVPKNAKKREPVRAPSLRACAELLLVTH